MASATDRFETVLASARGKLDDAREEYEALERTETVPQPMIQSLEGFERELNELDDRLTIEESDIDLAETTAARITALYEVLSALSHRQRVVVEAAVTRLGHQLTLLDRLDDSSETGQKAEQQYSMLCRLVENDRHDRVYGNDRLSLGGVERKLRTARVDRLSDVTDSEATVALQEVASSLLEDVHEYLANLGDDNEDRTAFAADLTRVKELLSTVEERDDPAPESAATAFEGCLMLHYSTARAYADQQMTEALADTVTETGLTVDINIENCVSRGAAEDLLEAVAAALETETEQSATTRLRQLIVRHDGSVERTAAATEFDVADILEQVTQLHSDGEIADITIDFKS